MDDMYVPPRLINRELLAQKEQQEALALGLYYGFFFVLILAGICIFLLSRLQVVLYTSLHLLMSTFITLSWDRLLTDWIVPVSGYIFGSEYAFFAIAAAIIFLINMRRHIDYPMTPWMDMGYRYLLIGFILQLLGLFIAPFLPMPTTRLLVYVLTLGGWILHVPLVSLTIYHATLAFFRKKSESRFLLLAIVALMLGVGIKLGEFFDLHSRVHNSISISVYIGFGVFATFVFIHIGEHFQTHI